MKRLLAILLAISVVSVACGSQAGVFRDQTSSAPVQAPPQNGAAAAAPTTAAQRAAVGAPASNAQDAAKAGGAVAATDASAEQPATTAASGGQQPAAQPTPESTEPAQPQPDRMIIYTTSLTLLVKDLAGGVSQLGDIATSLGGYVAGVEEHFQDEQPSAVIKLKVPAAGYQAAMNRLRSQGVEARDAHEASQDVTEEYSDLQNQLASLQATYNQYLELMKRTQTVDEILKLQRRIDEVKLQIDRIKGRSTFLEKQSAFATITVTLQLAEPLLVQEYSVATSEVRNLEAQKATLQRQIARARTDEERNGLLAQLSSLQLTLDKKNAQLERVKQLASKAAIQLPTPDLAQAQPTDVPTADVLAKQYLDLRVQIERAQQRQAELKRLLSQRPLPANADQLRDELKQLVNTLPQLNQQLNQVVERARAQDIPLPEVDAGLLAVLVGGDEAPLIQRSAFWQAVTEAWQASLTMLSSVGIALAQVLVFFWWLLPLLVLAGFAGWRGWLARRNRVAVPPAPPAPSIPSA